MTTKVDFNRIPLVFLPTANKPNNWEIAEDMSITLSNGDEIVIPKGMVFDGRSTPFFLRGLLPAINPALLAYIIHDYLYQYDYKRKEWGDKRAKEFADKEMKYWADKIYSCHADNEACYWGVRFFGKWVFKKWKSN